MYCVCREVYCPDGALLQEYLYVDSQHRAYWTGFASQVTIFGDFENADRYAKALNLCYNYDLCHVTFAPGVVPEFNA